jgi:hypothetical protein
MPGRITRLSGAGQTNPIRLNVSLKDDGYVYSIRKGYGRKPLKIRIIDFALSPKTAMLAQAFIQLVFR